MVVAEILVSSHNIPLDLMADKRFGHQSTAKSSIWLMGRLKKFRLRPTVVPERCAAVVDIVCIDVIFVIVLSFLFETAIMLTIRFYRHFQFYVSANTLVDTSHPPLLFRVSPVVFATTVTIFGPVNTYPDAD